MARPQSTALAGSFPTPPELLPLLASLVAFDHHPWQPHVLVDPCAGDGRALAALADAWFPNLSHPSDPAPTTPTPPHLYAIELELHRYRRLAARLPAAHTFHGDAFHFALTGADQPGHGASLLFLNPPYDLDRRHGRLEQRFLDRWTAALAPGAGLLLFLLPHYALAASARHLARHFRDLRAWRFPDPFFDPYRQCALLARRRTLPVADDEPTRHRLAAWAADATLLPPLHLHPRPPYRVALAAPRLHLQPTPIDLPRLLAAFRPWRDLPLVATDRTVHQLFGAPFPVALPPRPAHIALALAAGMLNGHRLHPDHPGLPPLLVKGTLDRTLVTVEERFDRDGRRTGTVQVQRPRLALHVLRLDTLQFHRLRPVTVPAAATGRDVPADLADFTVADLLDRYRGDLTRLLRRQFPALHDPTDPAHRLDLPRLARMLYTAQHHLVCAGLKLLARGDSPLAVAEMGTGKSTLALAIAGALQPRTFPRTTAELRRLGFATRRLRPVHRLLVVCPPHLLKNWTDQARAVLPRHRVTVLATLADLDLPRRPHPHHDPEIYLLSHETAKLGHAVAGLRSGRCPRCGADLETAPDTLATTRARCTARRGTPRDRTARLADALAATLLPAYPDAPTVRHLAHRHRTLRRPLAALSVLPHPAADPAADAATDPAANPAADPTPPPARRGLDPAALRPHVRDLLALVEHAHATGAPTRRLAAALHRLALAAGLQHDLAADLVPRLPRLAAALRAPAPAFSPDPDALAALDLLADLGTWDDTPCGEPLFQAAAAPRRYPLARWIARRLRRHFDLLVLDEAHKFSTLGSAQQKAAHRLVQIPGVPTLALSGSLMGGYASSLFANFWALSRRFRREFRRTERPSFVRRYGYRKLWIPDPPPAAPAGAAVAYGTLTDRETPWRSRTTDLGETPGILPTFLLHHLLPAGLFLHKADLDHDLPALRETPAAIDLDPGDPYAAELAAQYRLLLDRLARQIRRDLGTPLAGKLWGAMAEAPSYLDRSTDDLPPFLARYPADAGGAVVVRPRRLPAAWLTPKERWALDRLAHHLRDGRNVLLFLRHTGTSGLPQRWQRLLRRHLDQDPVLLDPRRVRAADRETWLDDHVVRPGRRLLLANPRAVETGLNNLVHFSRALWIEGLDWDARTVRQANGRLHRLGQTHDVLIEIPYYAETVQKAALDLVTAKITASREVDGLSVAGALATAGATAGEDGDPGPQADLAIGRAIYDAWLAARPT